MSDPVWLDPRVVEAVHDRLLAEHGGAGDYATLNSNHFPTAPTGPRIGVQTSAEADCP